MHLEDPRAENHRITWRLLMTIFDKVCYSRHSSSMNVSLTPEMERWVQQKVSSGFYTSASEVIREALRELFYRETLESKTLGNLTGSTRNRIRGGGPGENWQEWTPAVTEELKMLARKRRQA